MSHSVGTHDLLRAGTGSGQGTLRRLLKQNPRLFQQPGDEEAAGRVLSASDIYNAIRFEQMI